MGWVICTADTADWLHGELKNINRHMPTAAENKLIFIEKTGHTYQQKEQEIADIILETVKEWHL